MITLRPRRSLLAELALPLVALAVPVSIVLLWLAPPTVSAPVAGALVVLFCFGLPLAILAFRRTHISISRFGVVERGILGITRAVPAGDVAEIVRLQLYRSSSLETTPQLFAIGRDGRCLLRLRGGFWDHGSLGAIAGVLGVRETVEHHPMTLRDLQREHPERLDWFERLALPGRAAPSGV